MFKKIIISLQLFIFALFFMSACQKTNSGRVHHLLKLNFLNGDPLSLHPHFSAGETRCECLGTLLFECLTRSNAKGEVLLAGAKDVSISSDKMQYVFTLRESYWSDGSLVNAFQYENAWKEGMKPTSACPRADLFYVIKNAQEIKKGSLPLSAAGVKALDERTLFVELAFPLPVFLEFLSHPIFAPLQNPQEDPVQYNGAFVLDKWVKGSELNLKKNLHFWRKKEVFLDEIKISLVLDPIAACYLYQKGELDWLGDPICTMPDEVVRALEVQKKVNKIHGSRVLWLPLNTTVSPLDSVLIRRALSLALDREAINQYILVGNPLYSPLPLALSFTKPSHGQKSALAQEYFQQGLQEKGLTLATFPALTLRFPQVPRMKEVAAYLKETWQKILGIDVQLQCFDWNTFRSNLTQGNFQIGCCYDKPHYLDPLGILEKFEFISTANPNRWTDAFFKEKIAIARTCTDEQKRNQYFQELENRLIDEVPVIPISDQIQLYTHSPGLTGYVFNRAGYVDFSFAKR